MAAPLDYQIAVTPASSAASSVVVQPPACSSGDLLVLAAFGGGTSTTQAPSVPSGWTRVSASGAALGVFTKAAASSESAYTVTFAGACCGVAVVAAYPPGTLISDSFPSHVTEQVTCSPSFPAGVTSGQTVLLAGAVIANASDPDKGSGSEHLQFPGTWDWDIPPVGPAMFSNPSGYLVTALGLARYEGSTSAPELSSVVGSDFYAGYLVLDISASGSFVLLDEASGALLDESGADLLDETGTALSEGVVLDESGAALLDEAGNDILDESGEASALLAAVAAVTGGAGLTEVAPLTAVAAVTADGELGALAALSAGATLTAGGGIPGTAVLAAVTSLTARESPQGAALAAVSSVAAFADLAPAAELAALATVSAQAKYAPMATLDAVSSVTATGAVHGISALLVAATTAGTAVTSEVGAAPLEAEADITAAAANWINYRLEFM